MKHFYSIRTKSMLSLFFVLFVTILGLTLLAKQLFEKKFQELENKALQTSINSLRDAYQFDLDELGVKLTDWAAWDDTYKFIIDKNIAYIESNLNPAASENLRIDFMIFINPKGEIVATNGEKKVPEKLKQLLKPGSPLISYTNVDDLKSGILQLGKDRLMFASRPISSSDRTAPARGSLLFARYLSNREVEILSTIVHRPVALQDIPSLGQSTPSIEVGDKDTLYGYTVINDFFGKPAFMFRISFPRDITKEGISTVNYFVYSSIVEGIVLVIVLGLLIDFIFVRRIKKLSQSIELYGYTKLPIDNGHDEISKLIETINTTVTRLQEVENKFTVFMNMSPNLAWIKDPETWTYVYVNKAFATTFKTTLEVLSKKTDFDLWPKEVAIIVRSHDEQVLQTQTIVQSVEDAPDPQGAIHHWLTFKFPLMLDNKTFVAGVATDVTDMKNIEAELIKKTSELEKINNLMIGRELKMVELKKQNEKLKGGDTQ